VTVADTRSAPPQLPALQKELPAVRFIAGDFAALMSACGPVDLILRSPGLSPAEIAPVMQAAKEQGLAWGNELTLFSQALRELGEEVVQPEQEGPDLAQLDAELDEALAGPLQAVSEEVSEDVAAEAEAAEAEVIPDATQVTEPADEDSDTPLVLLAPPPATLAYRPKVIAITGTNGKTTVTALTGQLVRRAGKTVAVAGNIGPTLLDTLSACIDSEALPDVWVLELSSFQLDEVTDFEPSVATVLNISQDHLDWHGSMDAYVRAKSAVHGSQSVMLLNREDPLVMQALPAPVKAPARAFGKPPAKSRLPVRKVHTFGADMPTQPGDYGIETVNGMAWLVRATEADETIKRRHEEDLPLYVQRLMPVDALRIRGRHNATNALAALGLATAAGCSLAPMLHGLRDYRGEPHRVESVAVVRDVEYFDDSKGTNVGATAAALNGLGAERRLVLILGGEGKGQDFTPLAAPVARYARAVVLIGRDAPLIRAALEGSGVELLAADSMAEAVTLAAGRAQTGDAVLMSPACASFDMFDNYGHRAQVFCDAVQALAQDAGVSL
jgi:UDP-N-acetylmuramoylalanine--D-glutamate ligase